MDRRSFFASVSAVLAAPLAALGMGRGGFKPRHLPRGGLVIKRPVPAAGLFLTCSVDVLQDRLEVEVLAWGRGLRSYSVCTGEIGSFKSRSEQWQDLESLLLVDLPCTGGGTMPIWLMGIDAGYRWSEVYDFCLRHPAMQVDGSHGVWKPPSVIPIKGGGSGQKLIESVSMFRRNGRAEKEPLPVGQNMRVVTVGSFADAGSGRNLALAVLCGGSRFTGRDWDELERKRNGYAPAHHPKALSEGVAAYFMDCTVDDYRPGETIVRVVEGRRVTMKVEDLPRLNAHMREVRNIVSEMNRRSFFGAMTSTIAAPISVLALDSKPFVGVKAVVTGELTGTQRASLQADMDRLYAQSVHIIHTNGLMSREEAIALNYGPGKIEDVEAEIKRDYERAKALGLLPVWRKT